MAAASWVRHEPSAQITAERRSGAMEASAEGELGEGSSSESSLWPVSTAGYVSGLL